MKRKELQINAHLQKNVKIALFFQTQTFLHNWMKTLILNACYLYRFFSPLNSYCYNAVNGDCSEFQNTNKKKKSNLSFEGTKTRHNSNVYRKPHYLTLMLDTIIHLLHASNFLWCSEIIKKMGLCYIFHYTLSCR